MANLQPWLTVLVSHRWGRKCCLFHDDSTIPTQRTTKLSPTAQQKQRLCSKRISNHTATIATPPPTRVTTTTGRGLCGDRFPLGEDDLHVAFSTDCTHYQAWQAVVLFHSAILSGHKGPITQLVSFRRTAAVPWFMKQRESKYTQTHTNLKSAEVQG